MRRSRQLAVLAVVVIAAVPSLHSANGRTPALAGVDGTVYVESNAAAPRANAILAFRYRDGVLDGQGVRRYPTGGSGSHDLSNSGVLDADQEITVNRRHTLLFAVNAGSDTIAAFHIGGDGALTPVAGSPFPSHGRAPSSIGLAGSTLIVAYKAQDGVRDLRADRASYTSFHVRGDGSLRGPVSSIAVPPGSSPLQAYVTPDQRVLISSEETGVFRAFRIGRDGTLTVGPNSPLPLAARVFRHQRRVPNVWPAGLESHPTRKILYAQVANLSKTIVYRWTDAARLTFVRALPNRGSFLPCWTHVNAAGTRMYSGNAGSDNMTVFDISRDPTDPRELQTVRLNAPGNPWNFQLDPTGHMIVVLDMRAVRQIPAGKGNQLHVLQIGEDGRLTEEPSSPVAIPVPVGTNPIGLAIVAAR